ncbi:MAG: DUF2975 domain-containing protein [Sphingomicrobium sp.]
MFLLRFTQVMIGIAAAVVLLVFVAHLANGGPFTASWPVVTTDAVIHPLQAGAGSIRIDHGLLALSSSDWRPELAQLLFVMLFAGGATFAVIQLMHVVRSIAKGEPFAPETARRLRIIGWLAIAWAGFDVAIALVLEPLLLSGAAPLEPGVRLASSLAKGANYQLDFRLDFVKIGAGLVALALAQAFAIGGRLAEDDAAIV